MKKIILAIALFAAVSANAQNDGFFTSTYMETREAPMGDYPALIGHDLRTNQPAPLGSGLLILGGMALAYSIRKRN